MSLKYPEWNNPKDRALFEELFYKNYKRPLNKDEQRFCTIMYNLEEYASGLGGDEWTE